MFTGATVTGSGVMGAEVVGREVISEEPIGCRITGAMFTGATVTGSGVMGAEVVGSEVTVEVLMSNGVLLSATGSGAMGAEKVTGREVTDTGVLLSVMLPTLSMNGNPDSVTKVAKIAKTSSSVGGRVSSRELVSQ
jgi:hypothetical protein